MKKSGFLFVMMVFAGIYLSAQTAGVTCRNNALVWHPVPTVQAPSTAFMRFHPRYYLTYILDETTLKAQLFNVSSNPSEGIIIALPLPDGSYRDFKVWQYSMIPDELAAKYPDIKTFAGEVVGNKTITATLDFTLFGFHAMILEPGKTAFIDPYDNLHDGYYFAHYKKDEVRNQRSSMKCFVQSPDENIPTGLRTESIGSILPKLDNMGSRHSDYRSVNGWQSNSYRLALSADSFYCNAATGIVNPTIAQAFSAMTTTMNRVNGIYNRELSIRLNFCAHEDTLIYGCSGHTNGADPFTAIDANAPFCTDTNQVSVTRRIAAANYDIGHVFTTGGGGLSALGVVCNNATKAQSVTGISTSVGDGFDVDYVAHELGHEFGAHHTFNNNSDGSCGGSAVSAYAYEPGSGATIMDYAGRCSPDDLQPNNDAYFNASALDQVTNQVIATESVCAVTAATGNHVATLAPFAANYTIPYHTPFELTGPTAIDSVADTANTYQWLQWNLGDFGNRLDQTYVNGPIFRSFNPVYTPTRVFPQIDSVLSGNLSDAGTENAEGEKAPDTARNLTFRLLVRSVLGGYGCFLFPVDSVYVSVWQTGLAGAYQGFTVTSQGTAVTYAGGSAQTITWNVIGTNAAPVNAANVDIFMSIDGGHTWPFTVGTFPNTGSASITVPVLGGTSTLCRFKVKGHGNIFFNVNKSNFTVTAISTGPPITGTLTVCAGATTTLADAATGGTWSSGIPGVATISSAGVVTGISAGIATITYLSSTDTATAIVTVNGAPATPSVLLASPLPCTGATTATYVATAAGATSFSWLLTGTGWSGASATNTISVTLGTGTGTLVCTAANSCGGRSDTSYITASPYPSVPAITLSGPEPCIGSTSAVYNAVSSGATSYSWTVLGVGWSGSSTTSVLTVTIGSGTGTIICTGVNSCGGGSSDTIYLTPSTAPSASMGVFPTTGICAGSTATFITSAIAGATSYLWTVSGTGWSGSSTSALITVTVGTGPGTIMVAGVNSCGSGTGYALAGITPFIAPTVSFSLASHTENTGVNDLLTYTGTTSASGTYTWNFSGGSAIPGIGVGPHLVSWAAGGLKTITLTVTDTGCTSLVFSDTVRVLSPVAVGNVNQEAIHNVRILPNPGNGVFEVLFGETINSPVGVRMTDMQGRIVFEHDFMGLQRNNIRVDAGYLPNGIYTATIAIDGFAINKKVVVCR